MTTIAIVHHSGTGYTALLADAVAEGAAAQDAVHGPVKVERWVIAGADIVEGRYRNDALFGALDAADAIVFGTPTYMGGVSAQMKAFFDASVQRWYTRAWSGKLAAAFTVSSTPGGDKLNALTDVMIVAMQHGMLWVGLDESPVNREGANRLGFYLGAAAQPDYTATTKSLQRGDDETGRRLGARVARVAAALEAGTRA